MNYLNASAPARPASRTLAAIGKSFRNATGIATVLALAAALTMAGGSFALAQQAAPAAPAAPCRQTEAARRQKAGRSGGAAPAPAAQAPAPAHSPRAATSSSKRS